MAVEMICGIVQTLMAKVGEEVARGIKNQLTHLCCHHFHIERLTEEVQKMEIKRQTVQQAIDVALRNLESIRPDIIYWTTMVDNWLIRSREILEKSRHHHNNTKYKSFFSKWLPMVHYLLSVEAQKATNALLQLQITPSGGFDRVSNPSNPTDLEPVPLSMSEILLGSRDLLEKQVMDALEDDATFLIGLCGMGGVGKTTMAIKMKNWAKSSNMFEFVIFTTVSRGLDIKEVQTQIAGLGLPLKEQSQHICAEKINARLKAAKSFLIIFDDVWERLDLAKIGIPSRSTTEKRKLILTSRNQDTLVTSTKDHKIFKVDVLPDEEAWKLFREVAGDLIEEPGLVETTKLVAKHCKGLPLALVVVGSALRDKSKSMWKDALVQLERSHMPSNILGVREDLYIPLKWSYEQLPSEEARYIFLLCCLFPEDAKIPIELLLIYGWGLHVFNEIETIREARDRVSFLVDILKCRFLLTEGKEFKSFLRTEKFVKVHDVLRDMGISIACKDRYVFMVSEENWPRRTSYENITHIFVELKGQPVLPETLNCARLEFLHIGNQTHLTEVDLPEKFFSSMKGLKVLSAYNIILLPSSISMLTNLQAICIVGCQLGNMELVFENMVNLEIITLRDSTLEAFPREIGQLKNLKVLDLTGCEIESIESRVISDLVQLEELLLIDCKFGKEEEAEKEKMKVLVHIGSLSNLVNLQINFSNSKRLLSLDQVFPPKLERFVLKFIDIGRDAMNYAYYKEKDWTLYNKVALISCMEEVPIKSFILSIIRSAEGLVINGDCCIGILNELGKANFQELKLLSLYYSENAEYLVPTVASQSLLNRHSEKNGVLFPTLESLFLCGCENLKEICFCPPSTGSFGSLKKICLEDMYQLKHALPISKFQICSHLEVLKIRVCEVMEHIFWEQKEEVQISTKIKFLRLKKIELFRIPEMEVFCEGIKEIEFSALRKLVIGFLPKMTNFVSITNCNINHQFLFSKQVLFSLAQNLLSLSHHHFNLGSLEI